MKKDHQYDYMKLGQKLGELRSTHPEFRELMVASKDEVQYQDLVNTIDVCMTNGFDDVSVSSTF